MRTVYKLGLYAVGVAGTIAAIGIGGYVDRMLGGDGLGGGIMSAATELLVYPIIINRIVGSEYKLPSIF